MADSMETDSKPNPLSCWTYDELAYEAFHRSEGGALAGLILGGGEARSRMIGMAIGGFAGSLFGFFEWSRKNAVREWDGSCHTDDKILPHVSIDHTNQK